MTGVKKGLALVSVVVVMALIGPGELLSQCRTDLTPEEAKNLLDTNLSLIVVDVREQSEYCGGGGHIPGALNYPWISGVLNERYGELPADDDILVVCKSGGRSLSASNFLCDHGFSSIYNMTGGMSSWEWETEHWPCCSTGEECNDGNICTDESCSGGLCQYIDNTNSCDDGLFCTLTDKCSGGVCKGEGSPCESCELCDEEMDQCYSCTDDCDCDGITDLDVDNCMTIANGPLFGTCAKEISGVIVGTGLMCTDDSDCLSGETCQQNQEDFNLNGVGDVCECYADNNCDRKVDLLDLVVVKAEFSKPCPPSPCQADSNNDGKVDLSDVVITKTQFFQNSCPSCPQ